MLYEFLTLLLKLDYRSDLRFGQFTPGRTASSKIVCVGPGVSLKTEAYKYPCHCREQNYSILAI